MHAGFVPDADQSVEFRLFSPAAFPIPCPLMCALEPYTPRIRAGVELTYPEIQQAAHALTSPEVSDASKADFLRALAVRGETAAELAGFARVFRQLAIDPGVHDLAPAAIDVVGTGGDHAGGFNISTLVVLTLAALGVPVMKHGNRGVTSKCGSADLFGALGYQLDAPPEKLRGALRDLGYVFFFAPAFHPAFRHIAPVRKALAAEGQRTLFNILGPMVNPGRPAHVLLGVFSRGWVSRLADAFDTLGVTAGLVAHGIITEERGIDELTTATSNVVRGLGRLREVDAIWTPEEHGLPRSDFEDLKGGDLATNTAIVEAILEGRGPAGLVNTISFNAGCALWICGRTASVRDGVAAARDQLLGGGVRAKIAATRDYFRA